MVTIATLIDYLQQFDDNTAVVFSEDEVDTPTVFYVLLERSIFESE